jgi:hypothetical protein
MFTNIIVNKITDKIQYTHNELIPIQCCNLQAANLNHAST